MYDFTILPVELGMLIEYDMMISEMGGYDFYKNHFIGKTPNDLNITRLSRTVGKDQVVDEFILSFTP
ncbi:MAG: hypothetical protein WBF33_33785 [Candidatus Nitrosopolaris sp.]